MSTEMAVIAISGGLGSLLLWFFQSTLSDLKKRLDRMEQGLGALLSELKAGNVQASTNSAEIAILRTRMHDLSNDVHLVKITQQKCRHCNGDTK
jgi:hypothetical protein